MGKGIHYLNDALASGEITKAMAKKFYKFHNVSLKGDKLAKKAIRFQHIYDNSENGYVVPVTVGCDCDGVQYRSIGKPQKAAPLVLEKNEDEAYEWADGTMDIYYVKPSKALKMTNASVDRAAEAFENGHPHSITLGAI